MAKKRPKVPRRILCGERASARPQCGLRGATTNLTKTECCGNWICDDEDQYVLFSYARNSCYRNHDRYTLCRPLISTRDTRGNGKTARNAANPLRPRCMSGMERTNTTSRR